MQVPYNNSANQTAKLIDDKSSTKISSLEEAEYRKILKLPANTVIIDWAQTAAETEMSPEQIEAKAKLMDLYWAGHSIPKDLLQEAQDFREAKKFAKTLEEAEALWTNIVGNASDIERWESLSTEQKQKIPKPDIIEGKPLLKSFLLSEKAKVLIPVWQLNNSSAARKAKIVEGTIGLYNQGKMSVNELNQLSTDLLNVKSFAELEHWKTDENTNIDSLIDQLNKALINE